MSTELFSRAVLEVHCMARTEPMVNFQQAVLGTLRRYIHFDSAWWGIGSRLPDGLEDVHASALYRLPSLFPGILNEVQREDLMTQVTAREPGLTVNLNQEAMCGSARMREVLQGFEIAHCMCTSMPLNEIKQMSFLSLYRSAHDAPFSESEREFKQWVMPHLTAALTTNWMLHLERLRSQQASGHAALAIVDRRGVLHVADDALTDLIRSEWPGWTGPRVPTVLVQHLSSGQVYRGKRLKVRFHPIADFWLVDLRHNSALERLTAREGEVAGAFAEGASYKEAARALGIAPNTARHHLREVYRKLGVSGKAELVRELALNPELNLTASGISSVQDLTAPEATGRSTLDDALNWR